MTVEMPQGGQVRFSGRTCSLSFNQPLATKLIPLPKDFDRLIITALTQGCTGMGLAGRKEKQRIGPDPRNLTWAQDNSRFGQQYLAKFGWTPDSGSGLGANGDGRLAHISVAQKLNLLGIGNGPPSGGANNPDAIAWKQSKDFEGVLKRLNGGEVEEVKIEQALLHGFVRGEITESTIGNSPVPEGVLDEKAEKQRRKEERKRRKQEQAEVETDAMQDPLQASSSKQPVSEVSSSNATPTSQPKSSGMGPRMAHRAKFRASKQLASLSSAALSEILGVSPSGSATPISIGQSNTVPVTEQPVPSGNGTPTTREDQLTTSTTSVADYFAAKMKARRLGTQPLSESQIPLESGSPEDQDQEEDKPREKKREKGKDKKRKREVERIEGGEDTMDVDEAPDAPAESGRPHESRKEETRKERKKKRRKEVQDA